MNTLPLILLPGTLCDAFVWRAQMDALAPEREVRVCELGTRSSMREEVASMLTRLPARFYLAGFSLGGIVAFEVLRQARERVAGVAFIASTARPDPADSQTRRRALLARAQSGDLAGVLHDALLPHYLSPSCASREALSTQLVEMAQRSAQRFANQTSYASERPDSRPMLPSLDMPVTIVYGKDDQVIPFDRQAEMAQAIPHAVSCGIEACGHFVPLEAPHACSHALKEMMT
ncbi:alpha/beta hydrolase [Caballeronia sp. LZ035]|uniref:alpha/beta fold hydrolase n=1 Tax=Caballeronia sp. LZ035 TaxID=3038568 RepID=UPI00285468B2|nr:alpha/beta hydrolase [Caballeronia sp. LZ035]MDR5761039.1 alpha/beta hydrolase [Caballeronia sp. LZ035]